MTELSDLQRHREVQQLAYRCAEEVGAGLEPGVTEREAAARLRRRLVAEGVDDWFHIPFAWFGDRTAFRGFRTSLQFFPTNRRLAEGDPFILDCAPIVDGYTADIGYAGCLGRNPIFEQLVHDLADYRPLILDLVRERRSLRSIYEEVDRHIVRQGFDNRHRMYPGRVIAHQVGRVRSRLPRRVVAGFGIRSLQTLARDLVVERRAGRSPLWSDKRRSDHPPTAGLWAVEPHIGFRDVGVKFEELLVVTADDAFWLDDALPHVRRWQEAA